MYLRPQCTRLRSWLGSTLPTIMTALLPGKNEVQRQAAVRIPLGLAHRIRTGTSFLFVEGFPLSFHFSPSTFLRVFKSLTHAFCILLRLTPLVQSLALHAR